MTRTDAALAVVVLAVAAPLLVTLLRLPPSGRPAPAARRRGGFVPTIDSTRGKCS